jgi:uncharacterized membrane protein
VFVGSLVYAAGELPARVASHFDLNGRPNGWMSREADLLFMGLIGIGLPLFIIAVSYATGFVPKSLVNLPYREYWLAPERRKETAAYVGGRAVWMACMMLAFLTLVHLLVVEANGKSAPHLSGPLILSLAGIFLIGTGVWVWRLYQHFNKVPEIKRR